MFSRIIVAVTMAGIFFTGPSEGGEKKRKRHPLAPSLPVLTNEESTKIDSIINRFILYDSGKLPGADGKKILADLNALGPEATLNLVQGLNRAAALKASCPAVILARKVRRLVLRTRDLDLVDFIRQTVGAGTVARRHFGVLRDLRLACITRKSYLQRNKLAINYSGKKTPAEMTTDELLKEAEKRSGKKLMDVLLILEKKQGDKVIDTLGRAMASKSKNIQQLGQTLLLRHLARQKPDVLKKNLQSKRAEIRAATAHIIGLRKLPWIPRLIALLADESQLVRQAARGSLVRLSQGKDFGPVPGSTPSQRTVALRQWELWWRSVSGGATGSRN